MKKFMIITLAGILLTFILASCNSDSGNNNAAPPENNSNDNNNSIEAAESLPESEFQPLENVNYGGYKFRILGPGPNPEVWSAVIGTINEIAPEEETGDPINDAVYKRNKEVEALYNAEIIPVFPGGDRSNVERAAIQSILAGDDAYDAALMMGSSMPTILNSKNYTYDLFEIPNLDLSKSWWNQNCISELSIANKLHLVTGDVSAFGAITTSVLFYNKELAKTYALENAYDLVRQGKWTWDKVIEMSRAVSRDLNGDGIMDENDLYGICGEHAMMRFYVYGSGERVTKKDENDIPYLTINTPNTIKAIDFALESFLNKDIGIFVNDYINKYPVNYWDVIMDKFRSDELLFIMLGMHNTFDFRGMESDFGILPYPKLSEQQDRYYAPTSRWHETYIYIPATCPDIGRTGAALEALGYYSQKYVRPAVIDVTVTNKLIRDDDSEEMLNLMFDTRVYDIGELYHWGNFPDNLLYPNADKRTNVFASQYEKFEDRIKSAIEKAIEEMLK